MVKLDVAVLDTHAEPLNVAAIRLFCFLVFVFFADQRQCFTFATTARCVYDYALNLELVDVGRGAVHKLNDQTVLARFDFNRIR